MTQTNNEETLHSGKSNLSFSTQVEYVLRLDNNRFLLPSRLRIDRKLTLSAAMSSCVLYTVLVAGDHKFSKFASVLKQIKRPPYANT